MRIAMEAKNNTFAVLNSINCNEHVETKNGLSYLSWAWAWQIAKSNFPDANYTIYENADGWNYFTDGRTCWVKTGVTIQGQEHIEYLPVMDFKNRSIPLDSVTSFDVNKAIQRSLTKALARHGLGLYIYAGEDLPDAADDEKRASVNVQRPATSNYQPMSPEDYAKVVAAFARGMRTKTGGDYRQTWATTTHAGLKEIDQFNNDVAEYRINNNL